MCSCRSPRGGAAGCSLPICHRAARAAAVAGGMALWRPISKRDAKPSCLLVSTGQAADVATRLGCSVIPPALTARASSGRFASRAATWRTPLPPPVFDRSVTIGDGASVLVLIATCVGSIALGSCRRGAHTAVDCLVILGSCGADFIRPFCSASRLRLDCNGGANAASGTDVRNVRSGYEVTAK